MEIIFLETSLNIDENAILEYLLNKKDGTSLSNIKGDFSFALYDEKEDTYFCARDALGIKSLYFTKTEEGYRFSSELSELLKFPTVIKKPNLKSMKTMLYQCMVDYIDTMYEGIYRIPPGHFMTIKEGKEHIERYWFPEKIKIDHTITEAEAVKKLKELFTKAVNQSVTDLKETAFEVSGGLDSSSVVSLLGQTMEPSLLDSYSMNFGTLECDEGEYVNAILKKYPLNHQKIASEALDYCEKYALDKLYAMSPNWPITLTFAMQLPMLEKMKSDGKNVVITGQGGDHILTGSALVIRDLFRRFKFGMVYQEIKAQKKPWNAIKAYIIRPLIGEVVFGFLKKILKKSSKEIDPFMNYQSGFKNITEKIGVENPSFKNDLDMVTSLHHSTVMDGNLFHCAEEHFDIEFRHPFFDKELVEFALSMPPEMKYRKRTIKWIWRKAMDGILPDKIRDRQDKAEFSEVIRQQIDVIDLDSLLNDAYIVKLGLIEQSFIDKTRKAYEDKTLKYVLIFWTIINVEYWYRYNFEEESLGHP